MTQATFTQADLDAVSNSPELTDEQLRNAKPFAEAFPVLAEKLEIVQR